MAEVSDYREVARILALRLPMPVAWAIVRLARKADRLDPIATWQLWLDAFELYVRVAAAMATGAYLASGAPSARTNRVLLSRLDKRISLGDWTAILMSVLTSKGAHLENPYVARMRELYCTPTGRPSKDARALEEIVQARNRTAHGPSPTASVLTALLATHDEHLLRGLTALTEVQGLEVWSAVDVHDAVVETATSLLGPTLSWLDQRVDLDTRDHRPLPGDIFIRVARPEREWVWKLFPLQFVEEDVLEDTLDVVLLDGLALSGPQHRAWFTRVPSRGTSAVGSGDPLIVRVFSALASVASPTTPVDRGDELAPQRRVIDQLRATFVGRTHVLQRVGSLHGGTMLVVTSPPGQGKSSLAAALAAEATATHFFSSSAGRTELREAMASLAAQLQGSSVQRGLSLPELRERFHRALWEAASSAPITIVIDALDECADLRESEVGWIPEPLPAAAKVIVTSRPCVASEAHAARTDACVEELPGLSSAEIRALVGKRMPELRPSDVDAIVASVHGNPLLATLMAQVYESRSGGPSTAQQVPAKLYSALVANLDDASFRVLGALSAAVRPLTPSELRAVLGLSRGALREALRPVRSLLVQEGSELRLFHETLRDFLTRHADGLGSHEQARSHRELRAAAERGVLGDRYRDIGLPEHLLAVGDVQGFVVLADGDAPHRHLGRALARGLVSALPEARHTARRVAHELLGGDVQRLLVATTALHERMDLGSFDEELLERCRSVASSASGRVRVLLSTLLGRAHRETGKLTVALVDTAVDTGDRPEALPSELSYLEFVRAETLRELGRYREARELYERAIGRVDVAVEPGRWVEIEHHLADLLFVVGRLTEADERLRRALRVARESLGPLREGQVLRVMGHVSYIRGDAVAAHRRYVAARDAFIKVGDPIHLAKNYNNLAEAQLVRGFDFFKADPEHASLSGEADWDVVDDLLMAAIRLNESHNQDLELGKCLLTRAMSFLARGALSRASDALRRASEVLTAVGYGNGVALVRLVGAWLADAQGNAIEAVRHARACREALMSEDAYPVYQALALLVEARHHPVESRTVIDSLQLDETPHLRARLLARVSAPDA